MRFNDQTVLTCCPSFSSFRYFAVGQAQSETFQLGEEKEALQKKAKIITHFGKIHTRKVPEQTRSDPLVTTLHLVYHCSNNNYTFFWLSSDLFQV